MAIAESSTYNAPGYPWHGLPTRVAPSTAHQQQGFVPGAAVSAPRLNWDIGSLHDARLADHRLAVLEAFRDLPLVDTSSLAAPANGVISLTPRGLFAMETNIYYSSTGRRWVEEDVSLSGLGAGYVAALVSSPAAGYEYIYTLTTTHRRAIAWPPNAFTLLGSGSAFSFTQTGTLGVGVNGYGILFGPSYSVDMLPGSGSGQLTRPADLTGPRTTVDKSWPACARGVVLRVGTTATGYWASCYTDAYPGAWDDATNIVLDSGYSFVGATFDYSAECWVVVLTSGCYRLQCDTGTAVPSSGAVWTRFADGTASPPASALGTSAALRVAFHSGVGYAVIGQTSRTDHYVLPYGETVWQRLDVYDTAHIAAGESIQTFEAPTGDAVIVYDSSTPHRSVRLPIIRDLAY